MKKALFSLIFLMSFSAFAYDGGLGAKNCASSRVNENQIIAVLHELNDIGIKYEIADDKTGYADFIVTVMARNGFIRIDLSDGVDIHFRMNKKLKKVLSSRTLNNGDVDFRLTSVGACKEFKKD